MSVIFCLHRKFFLSFTYFLLIFLASFSTVHVMGFFYEKNWSMNVISFILSILFNKLLKSKSSIFSLKTTPYVALIIEEFSLEIYFFNIIITFSF